MGNYKTDEDMWKLLSNPNPKPNAKPNPNPSPNPNSNPSPNPNPNPNPDLTRWKLISPPCGVKGEGAFAALFAGEAAQGRRGRAGPVVVFDEIEEVRYSKSQ